MAEAAEDPSERSLEEGWVRSSLIGELSFIDDPPGEEILSLQIVAILQRR